MTLKRWAWALWIFVILDPLVDLITFLIYRIANVPVTAIVIGFGPKVYETIFDSTPITIHAFPFFSRLTTTEVPQWISTSLALVPLVLLVIILWVSSEKFE